jgi:hypothetical protein
VQFSYYLLLVRSLCEKTHYKEVLQPKNELGKIRGLW